MTTDNYNLRERKGDIFEITDGNLEVLKAIPEMMKLPEWRNRLRMLVMDFKYEIIGKK